MRNSEENDLASRRGAALEAKAALLKAHRAAREAAEPTRLQRQEERLGIAAARDVRRAARDQAKLDERERVRADAIKEQAIADAALKAKAEASEKALDDRISRVLADEATRKAERDRRYANRKGKKQ